MFYITEKQLDEIIRLLKKASNEESNPDFLILAENLDELGAIPLQKELIGYQIIKKTKNRELYEKT